VNLLGRLLLLGLSAVIVPSAPVQESTFREAETLLLGAGSTPGQLRWAGRILAGMLSDKLGRKTTMFLFFVLQAIAIFILSVVSGKCAPCCSNAPTGRMTRRFHPCFIKVITHD